MGKRNDTGYKVITIYDGEADAADAFADVILFKIPRYAYRKVLKMDMIGSMSMSTVEAIVDATSKLSFRNTAKGFGKTTNLGISHQTAWNVTQKLSPIYACGYETKLRRLILIYNVFYNHSNQSQH